MKKLGIIRLAFLFAGCFLGAGYVSGQELLSFFGGSGRLGSAGLLLAVILLGLFGVLILRLSEMTGNVGVDKTVVPWNAPALQFAVGVLEIVFMFGIATIMCAGVGALAEQLIGLPHYIASLIFAVPVLIFTLYGLRGMMSVFSVSVPMLVAATVALGAATMVKTGWRIAVPQTDGSPLVGGWVSGALVFSCSNIFGTIGILSPFGKYVKDRKTLYCGIGLGAAGLLLIASSVLISVGGTPGAASEELPMLAVAAQYGQAASWIYAVLLAAAMFGTSVSSLVGMTDYISSRNEMSVKNRRIIRVAAVLLAYAGSLAGFGDLVGVVYPIFGYSSAAFLIMMVIHYVILRKRGIS